jgi:hypothetical protein
MVDQIPYVATAFDVADGQRTAPGNKRSAPATCMAIAVDTDAAGTAIVRDGQKITTKQMSTPSKRQKVDVKPTSSTPSSKNRLKWNADDVAALLEVRFSELSKRKFNSCKTTKQKNEWWTWLAARLSSRLRKAIDCKQVKNKYGLIKAEYRNLVRAEKETGNAADSIEFPDYWESLVEHFQVILKLLCQPMRF